MKQSRVVVTDYNFPSLDAERAAAQVNGASFEAYQCSSAEQVAEAVSGASVVAVQFAPLTAAALGRLAPKARIVRYGVGYDNIDVEAAASVGHTVAYVPDYCVDEVADHTVAAVLASLRKLVDLDASVRAGQWSAAPVCHPMPPFSATVVGFLGLGRIGRGVMHRLRAFGFSFLVYDPALTAVELGALGAAKAEDLPQLFAAADVLTLHAPSTDETRHIVNSRTLRLLKRNAVIINTSRGDLIDAAALAEALRQEIIGGAVLDVFEREPLEASSPLRSAPHLLLSPHAAWYSDSSIRRLQTLVAEEIHRGLKSEPPRCPVPAAARRAGGLEARTRNP